MQDDLLFSDLFIACQNCRGSGRHDWVGPGPSRGLDAPSVAGSNTCPACGGLGGQLTPKGDALLRFMQLMKQKQWL